MLGTAYAASTSDSVVVHSSTPWRFAPYEPTRATDAS